MIVAFSLRNLPAIERCGGVWKFAYLADKPMNAAPAAEPVKLLT
jgi:hypothetical protein